MKIFIDTANVEEIQKANEMGFICGVTTNPSLIAKEGKIFKDVVTEITSIVDGPISAEVISLEADKMIEEALELIKISKNIVKNRYPRKCRIVPYIGNVHKPCCKLRLYA